MSKTVVKEQAKSEETKKQTDKPRVFQRFPNVQMRVYIVRQGENSDSGLRFLPNGTPVFGLSCAIQASYKERQLDPKTPSLWYRLEVYGDLARTLGQWEALGLLNPGGLLLVAGSLEVQHWQSEGEERQKLVLKGDEVALIARPQKDEGEDTASG